MAGGGYNKWAERKKNWGIERQKWIEQFLRIRQPVFFSYFYIDYLLFVFFSADQS